MNGSAPGPAPARFVEAAYAVLKERGYYATSMLLVAKRASASNETLYRHYANKQALFCALVAENARAVREVLVGQAAADMAPLARLEAFGAALLSMLLGERAVALNRAAAGDVADTHTLGPTIAAGGRDQIVPLLEATLEEARRSGAIQFSDADKPAEVYLALLIGDWQVRRVIGVMPEPTPDEVEARSARAFALFLRLFGTAGR